MAVRTPLYNNNGNLQDMTTAMVTNLVNQTIYQYSLLPGTSLSVVNSGGSLGNLTDTRLQAGISSSGVSSYPSEASTAEPSVVTVTYGKINQVKAAFTPTADTGRTWPVYRTAANEIQSMTLQDVKDTFLHPAIDSLVSGSTGSAQGGTYFIATTTSVAGATLVSSTPVFSDTRANVSAYTAGGIPESTDQPQTITNYYLHRCNGANSTYTKPMFLTSSFDIQEYSDAGWAALIQEWIRFTAAQSSDGYQINYSLSAGTNRGSGMGDTRLNGSGNYQQRLINANDYRAQEFPNGTAVNINTYYLKIQKI